MSTTRLLSSLCARPAEARVAAAEAAPGAAEPYDLADFIDHTLLKPATTTEEIDRVCDEALEYGLASACANPVGARRANAANRRRSREDLHRSWAGRCDGARRGR